jgi:cytochrome oxidase assembly protein ShyY1
MSVVYFLTPVIQTIRVRMTANSRMTVNKELERMWAEMIIPYFEVLFRIRVEELSEGRENPVGSPAGTRTGHFPRKSHTRYCVTFFGPAATVSLLYPSMYLFLNR